MIASVYVDIENRAVDQAYDYRVPINLEATIEIGQRVKIPFGNRAITGVVSAFKSMSTIKNLKAIDAIYDLLPLYDKEHLKLAEILSEQYATPRVKYLNSMIPSGLKVTYKKRLKLVDPSKVQDDLKALFKHKNTCPFDKRFDPYLSAVKTALDQGALKQITEIKQKSRALHDDIVTLNKDQPLRGEKQNAIITYLKTHGPTEKTALLNHINTSSSTLRTLIKKEAVAIVSYEKYRELETIYTLKDKVVTLNSAQQDAYEMIKNALGTPQTFLLHGVTSSGKTEIYIKLVETVLKSHQSVLILVPEISLTPALTARFKARFKEAVAVYHSHLSTGEKYDEWRKIKRQEAQIIIGARSAIFAPIKQIGLIIIDEEHSDAYLQEESPKYHARSIAFLRAQTHQAPVLLGSATPSIESYYRAKNGEYTLLTLKSRALKSRLPQVKLIDMKQAFLEGNTSIFSETVIEAMQDRFHKNEQTLILINRRGHASFILCRNCGKTIQCDDCSVSMTYHARKHHLMCHYCNKDKPMPETCPACHSKHIRPMGLGSERVESTLKALFPNANISRMDRDTTTTKNAHATILQRFESSGDFLVGTQMIAKGLDFENVTLVVVLSADLALSIPDFQAREETFSLLTQMAGRSGRRETPGDVLIQAFDTDHDVLQDVVNHDYEHFYQTEIKNRQSAGLPPFYKVVQITLTHKIMNRCMLKSAKIMREMKPHLSPHARLIGPVTPRINRIKDRFRNHIIIKYQNEPALLPLLNEIARTIDLKEYTFSIQHHLSII